MTDAAPQFGMTPGAIMNLVSRDKFPVPTYKLGKRRVIDRAVLQAFFEAKKAEGLSAREDDVRLIQNRSSRHIRLVPNRHGHPVTRPHRDHLAARQSPATVTSPGSIDANWHHKLQRDQC